jgi:hypothetical protein
MRAFLADDHPHALGPGGQLQHAGDLRHPGTRPYLAFGVIGGSPCAGGDLEGGLGDLLGDGEPTE